MIRSFRHKGLRQFFETGSTRGINAQWSGRLQARLTVLSAAQEAEDVNVSGWRLHELKGERAGTFAINVSGNWRLTFRFEDGDATDVNLEDYHGD